MYVTWNQAQHIIAAVEKLHSQSICPTRSMQLHKVEDWLTHCSILECVSHTTGCCNSNETLPMVSASALGRKMYSMMCPPKLRHGLFKQQQLWTTSTTIQALQLQKIPSTAPESQHRSHTHGGTERSVPVISQGGSSTKSVTLLPPANTIVPPAAFKTKDFSAPAVQGPVRPSNPLAAASATEDEYAWLSKVKMAVEKSIMDSCISWSAYHADTHRAVIPSAALNALLPLFLENTHSVAMIQHSMNIVKAAVQHLNPCQIPVLAADQHLYALVKEVQWNWPATHGEDHFVIIIGGLHIEMATLKLLGDWFKDSGRTNALMEANIARSRTANSFILASHIIKTYHAHQVKAASLYKLLQQAYIEDCTSVDIDAIQPDSPPFE